MMVAAQMHVNVSMSNTAATSFVYSIAVHAVGPELVTKQQT